jgi:hypothetical protein
MSWLENNPLTAGLASVCGALLLVSAVLVLVWTRPVAPRGAAAGEAEPDAVEIAELADELGPLSEYRVVTERPIFDETRRPTVAMEDAEPATGEATEEVAGAPEVKLTGVVITPELKMVTLKPLQAGETVIAIEGEPLEGDYAGWSVSEINPRQVVLASTRGGSHRLDLEVNTRRIEEPPKPPKAEEPAEAERQQAAGGDDEPLSRAEEIRQRIAERREELRREQEEGAQANSASQRSRYQEAIQQMMRRTNDPEKDEDP